VTKISN